MAPAWSVSWQPLATARYSKVCWVKESGLVAATIPALPARLRVVAAARIAAKVVGAVRPALANRSLRYTSSWVQLSLGTATGWPLASTRLRARWEKVWRPRVLMTAAAASGSVMPSAAKECTNPSDAAASTSGRDPAALALAIWDWSSSSPIATTLTLMLVCCSKRLTIAWVALTRSGLSSAVQNVRLLPLSSLLFPPPQPTAMSSSTTSRATRIVRAFMAAPQWRATLGTRSAASQSRGLGSLSGDAAVEEQPGGGCRVRGLVLLCFRGVGRVDSRKS